MLAFWLWRKRLPAEICVLLMAAKSKQRQSSLFLKRKKAITFFGENQFVMT
jgi:hypothetical protein